MEAERTAINDDCETFAVFCSEHARHYQVAYQYRANEWHIRNSRGKTVDPRGGVGRKIVEACRVLRRTVQ
jgi:hypothetical protein